MKMQHPEAPKPIEVDDRDAEMYRSQGWTEVEPKSAKSDDK